MYCYWEIVFLSNIHNGRPNTKPISTANVQNGHIACTTQNTHLWYSSFLRYRRNHRLEFAVFRQSDRRLAVLAPDFLSGQHRRLWPDADLLNITQYQHLNISLLYTRLKLGDDIAYLSQIQFFVKSPLNSVKEWRPHFIYQLRHVDSAHRCSLGQSQ